MCLDLERMSGLVDLDPYPLPFEGVFEDLPYGYLRATNTLWHQGLVRMHVTR